MVSWRFYGSKLPVSLLGVNTQNDRLFRDSGVAAPIFLVRKANTFKIGRDKKEQTRLLTDECLILVLKLDAFPQTIDAHR